MLRDDPGSSDRGLVDGRANGSSSCCANSAYSCEPERPVIARRGERKPIALPVEVGVGLVANSQWSFG